MGSPSHTCRSTSQHGTVLDSVKSARPMALGSDPQHPLAGRPGRAGSAQTMILPPG
jgi:hypothetical protein